VTRLSLAESSKITAEEIHFIKRGSAGIIHVEPADIVLVTIGSMTSSSSFGTNTSPPSPLTSVPAAMHAPDGSWELWNSLTKTPHHGASFGNPSTFFSRPAESAWLSFTVTLHDSSFFDRLTAWSSNTPGTGALITFTDSNWLMNIVVPKQPHFLHQPADVQVFWGYGLLPSALGNIIPKPMVECTGEEILTELLGLLNFPQHPTVESATTIPCMMPFITSQFLTRAPGDRPNVIPEGSTNLALLGQFVEIERDVVFTVEYSVRAAQMAVFGLMDVDRKPKAVYKGEHNVKVLAEGLKTLLT
jgi:oleate hydratase